ncbi:group II intron reverse transcriptase/maturase [Microcoleus sp. D2_18a_D3]|uniref:group II intron reverse transcriptase/maturase n=1 Tax=Microcoleus sp. D2_18a_D3 TaxID=3055330 RepID=UPI002FD5B0BC
MSNTESELATVEWKDIPWRKVERIVFKLQKRIFQASQRGDVRAVRKLQKTLINSWSAKVLAVRRVTQDNQGKKTAGIDGVKSLTPKQRLELVNRLRLNQKAKPTRRVWIPKPGREEKRPLGIPIMHDRATQALVKAALEPEWEAKFEPNSYGFRLGRSCHDAIGAIFNAIRYKPKYVLDADIAQCFDRISHAALLRKLNTSPTIRRQIRAWLKAGVIDWSNYANKQKAYSPTEEGTPQGGVISPLLANIALHGMENRIKQYVATLPCRPGYGKKVNQMSLSLIRYADDFVIIHEDLAIVQKCQEIIAEWLSDIGLELKPSKTRISHTLTEYSGNIGFDFLGFNIRQHPVGKYQTGKSTNKEPLGFKTIITPSKKSVKGHCKKIATIIKEHSAAPQAALIARLNPVIRGWGNYFSTVASQETFDKLSHITFKQLWAWAKRRCKKESNARKYWREIEGRKWTFATPDGLKLAEHPDTQIKRHTKVKGSQSPYDGDWVYWSQRLRNYPEIPKTLSELLNKQKGRCLHCGLYFTSDSLVEIHHLDKNRKNNKRTNLMAIHRHCHDILHAMWEPKEWEIRSDDFYEPIP